jgi:protein TonB
MGYQALLFCPDEKTARTVTQVLSELDFEVVPCTEPFAAVKQMMASHFDAIVVDCDNEQNATLLFKSARNAPNNQSALAVAVVEGQAGVAKAFRIGANLVLTKPINVEQAKGTLRVARGLLRKNETAKVVGAGAPAAAKTAVPEAPAKMAPKVPAAEETKADFTATPAPIVAEKSEPRIGSSVASNVASNIASHVASSMASKAEPQIETPLASSKIGPKPTESRPRFAAQASAPADEMLEAKESPKAEAGPIRPLSARSSAVTSGGAASAPAPSREAKPSELTPKKSLDIVPEPPNAVEEATETAAASEAEITSSVPAFAIGKTRAASPGSKKMLLAVAAIVVLAAAGYLAWMQFGPTKRPVGPFPVSSSPATPAAPPASLPTPASAPAPVATGPEKVGLPATEQPNTSTKTATTAAEAPKAHPSKPNATTEVEDSGASLAKANKGLGLAATKPIKIKNSPESNTPADDAAPPAIAAMPSANGGAMPSLLETAGNSPAPRLQTLNVSQGVSRGLLIKRVQPTYPADAMRLNVEGQVQLMATIAKSGDITAVKVLSGDSRLAHAAADAVKQWKYKPYLLNGEPVEIQTQVTINFKLPH